MAPRPVVGLSKVGRLCVHSAYSVKFSVGLLGEHKKLSGTGEISMRTSRWSLYLDHVQPVIGCHPCVSSPSCQSRNAAIEIAIRGMSAPPSYMSLMALTSPAEATRKDAACRHPVKESAVRSFT